MSNKVVNKRVQTRLSKINRNLGTAALFDFAKHHRVDTLIGILCCSQHTSLKQFRVTLSRKSWFQDFKKDLRPTVNTTVCWRPCCFILLPFTPRGFIWWTKSMLFCKVIWLSIVAILHNVFFFHCIDCNLQLPSCWIRFPNGVLPNSKSIIFLNFCIGQSPYTANRSTNS